MYEKMLFSGELLYFRFAPPFTALDEVSDDELPNAPFPGAKPHERSVYYLWWEYLRENEAYRDCCASSGAGKMADLYADFGDVRGGSFMDWWKAGARLLFCEPPEAQIVSYLRPPTEPIDDDRVLVSIPVTGDIDRTLAELRRMLKPAFAHQRRRRQAGDLMPQSFSLARYPVHRKPVLTALYERLVTWRKRHEHPEASLYELGKQTGMVGRTMGAEDDADHRNRVAASVSRYLREARALIHNVGEGRFPDFTPPPSQP